MLQRVWDAAGGRRVNLLNSLDRSASGYLILYFATVNEDNDVDNGSASIETRGERRRAKKGPTSTLIGAMQSPEAIKTYVAIVHGDRMDKDGNNLTNRGWFAVDNPVKDENGRTFGRAHVTKFRFVAGGKVNLGVPGSDIRDNNGSMEDRVTLVLAGPSTGRWDQIRQHLS